MVASLAAAGHTVTAYDLSPSARAATAGSVETLARLQGEVVVLMLPSSRHVESVLHDPDLATALVPGAVVVDMGSSDPRSTRALGKDLSDIGVALVDAPVSGGVARAERQELTIMVGGSAVDVERVRPLLEAMGQVTHVGVLGAGHAVKACNNVLAGISLLAAAEVLEVVRAFGLDPAVAFDVINSSTGRSWSTEHKIPTFVLPEQYLSGFGLDLLVKDIGIARDLAADLGVEHGLLDTAFTLWRRAASELPGEADHTSIAEWVAASGRGAGVATSPTDAEE
jgi:3-hydroxyisobutyrate dehydrogenase